MNRGKTVFLQVSSCLGKACHSRAIGTSFHGPRRCQDIACRHTCVSNSHLCFYGKMLQKPPCIPRCAQPILSTICVSNLTPRAVSAIRPHVKSRDGRGSESKRRNKTEETADMSDIFSGFGLHVHFFFSLSQQDGRRGRGGDKSAYQNERLQQFPPLLLL